METTVAKAKKMSGTAWKGGFLILIHAGVNLFACPGTQCAARRAASFVRGDDVLHKLFTELATLYCVGIELEDAPDCFGPVFKWVMLHRWLIWNCLE
ncbi:uncharacterized protein [Phaseolus vulgaris]|uniref:uncharacterized protein isoform X5 n=1 Tax=Phaseolus vulgaris TaxID=3885 RepID=UPI0035CA35B1